MTIGDRLREQREVLKLTQPDLAAAGEVSKTTQVNYEQGRRAPDADYLAGVAEVGVDVLYVVTGNPSPSLQGDELELLRRYRAASAEVRAAVMGALGAVVVAADSRGSTITGGEQGQVVMGSQTNHAPQTFNVGGKKGTKK